MIENRKGVESWGVRAWEWAGMGGESSGWKVWVYGQKKLGKFEGVGVDVGVD